MASHFEQYQATTSEEYYTNDNTQNNHSSGQSSLLKDVRKQFVRKVFSILSIQLAFTAFMILMSQQSLTFRRFQIGNQWLLTVSAIFILGSSLSIYFIKACTQKVPYNYLTLSIFTISEGYALSHFTLSYDKMAVLQAALLVAGATILLFLYACTTKKDITVFNSIIFIIISSTFFVSILNFFFFRSALIEYLLQLGSVVAYSFYLIFDIQLIMGQKSVKLDLDNYILGSLIIYVDIVQLFIKILQILGTKNEEENKDKKKK